ncbi:MAG TPA: solute carrier family 26 protein [Sandaracinaceae bacterium LLY-WYZ-13_1]|nr:solute carrier family 26 protein [Sandaracinaceae bacterium LLY-WYZ-13_1]
MNTLRRWIPALDWLRGYDRKKDLPGDLTAGLTVAVMLIPQAMAYAMLAGLPPIVGLYASVFPLFIYALFGTSRQLAVGPVAMVSLLVATGVGAIAEPGSQAFIVYAVVVAGMVGVIQLAMGVFRLGALVSFLSHPVISGFTSAAALIIGLSQLKHLLGIDIPRSPHLHELLMNAGSKITETHLITLGIGAASIALLMGLKKWNPRFPGALSVVVLGTLATWGLGLHERGVAIVGDVPAGLPSPSVPGFDWSQLGELLPTALAISLVGFMESISVAKALARKHKYEVEANKELVGLGLANVVGFFFGAYPVTGGFSRTAVNDQAGARTPLASMITAAMIGVSLLLFTPLFYFLPKAVLAAIVMTAVFGLIDVKEPRHLWKVKKTDALLLGLTFVVTLFVGIEEGIGAGVVASLALFVYRSTKPHNAVLGKLPGTENYRNVDNFEDAEEVPGLKIWRFDASFYFANADYFRDQIDELLITTDDEKPVRAILLDAAGINDLDASAETMLHDIHERLEAAGIALYFANVKGPVREVMKRGGLTEKVGQDHFFFDVHEAVQAMLRRGEHEAPAEEASGPRPLLRDADAA